MNLIIFSVLPVSLGVSSAAVLLTVVLVVLLLIKRKRTWKRRPSRRFPNKKQRSKRRVKGQAKFKVCKEEIEKKNESKLANWFWQKYMGISLNVAMWKSNETMEMAQFEKVNYLGMMQTRFKPSILNKIH